MRFDYWNDPLVVSAYRVRFRGGTPSILAGTYFLALVALGGILHYSLADDPRHSWVRIYFVVLISVETIVAGLFAMTATWQSMHAEVVNRTLDYQRIAAVPPRDILLGKLLGEPAQGYLLTLAGLPLVAWCWGMGAVPLLVLLPLLLQVVTTAVLLGTVGLMHPLDTAGDKSKMPSRTVRNVFLVIVGIYVTQVTIALSFMSSNPLSQVPLGMLTPIFSIASVVNEAPAEVGLPFFSLLLPWLYLTPFTQVAIAAIILHSITRRLVSPENVALGKPMAYAILAGIDVLVAGALLDQPLLARISDSRVVMFCLAHSVASLLMAFTITPHRECLRSWIWRFRGRQPWWKDALVGERSENGGALAAFCVIGLTAAILLVMIPVVVTSDITITELLTDNLGPLAAMCLIVLAIGSTYQLLVSIGQAGATIFVGVVATLVVVPHLVGAYLNVPEVMAMSPSAQFTYWIGQIPPQIPLWPLVAVYGMIFFATRYVLRRRIKGGIAAVERTVAGMLADEGQEKPLAG